MTSPRNVLLALVATGAAAFAAPGVAGAATICVHAPAGTACDAVEQDLQAALTAAQFNIGADTIALGDGGGAEQGPFAYPSGRIEIGNTVAIKGIGPVPPRLTAPAGATVLKLGNGSLESVDVQLPSSAAGVGIEAGDVTLRHVRVTGPGAASAGAQGIRAVGDLNLDDVDITGTGDTGLSTIAGVIDASRVRAVDVVHGVGTGEGSTLQMERSKVRARDAALMGLGTAAVSASLLESTAPNSTGVAGGNAILTLDHVTVVHRGPVDGTDAALHFKTVDGGFRADLSSVVLAGYTRGLRRDTTDGPLFPMTIRDSVWDSSHDVIVGSTPPVDESGNAHIDPALADLANGDFRLRGSSAAIDRDTRTDVRYVDVDGAGLVDGDANGVTRADAGAFEYQRNAPSIESADVPAAGVTGQALSFAATGFDADGDQLHFAWDFGDGTVGPGAQSTHAYAAPGVYTATLHVTDDAGLTATRTFTVAVTAAPPAAAGTAGSGGAGGAADLVAPRLSKVSLSKSRLSKSRLRAHSAKAPALRFTVSERATVRVSIGGVKIVKTVSAGRRSIGLTKALRRFKGLRIGRVAVKITATDPAGNRSAARKVTLRVVA
jgi:PKD domain